MSNYELISSHEGYCITGLIWRVGYGFTMYVRQIINVIRTITLSIAARPSSGQINLLNKIATHHKVSQWLLPIFLMHMNAKEKHYLKNIFMHKTVVDSESVEYNAKFPYCSTHKLHFPFENIIILVFCMRRSDKTITFHHIHIHVTFQMFRSLHISMHM